MDDHEDPLNKISRQLSELGPVPIHPNLTMGSDGSAAPDLIGDQWSQFGNSARPMPFHNLYTWNSLDLSENKFVSQPGGQHTHDYHSPEALQQSVFMGHGQNANSWSGNGHQFAPHHQLSNTDLLLRRPHQDGVEQMGFEQEPVSSHHMSDLAFHGDSVSPVVAPHSPVQTDFFSHSNVSPPHPDLLRRSSQPTRMYPPNFGSERMTSVPTNFFASECPAHAHSPPLFDPRTPPPSFLVHRQHSDSSVRPQTLSKDTDIFSQSQINKSKLDIDLGTNIEGPSVSFAGSIDQCLDSEEGRKMYQAAMDRWESSDNGPVERNNISPKVVDQVDKLKPTYSDIAKTPKNSQPPMAKVECQTVEDSSKATTPRLQKKEQKTFRPPMRRTSSGSKFMQRVSGDHMKGQVSSRYGLDDFSEHTGVSLSSSSESLSHTRTRRDSGSSAGSSISALDDIAVLASPDTQTLVKGRDTEHKSTTPGATKPLKNMAKSASKPVGKEHVFFDPKRIFQSKATSKPQSATAGVVHKAKLNTGPAEPYVPFETTSSSTLLNNGKPTAGSVTSKLSSSAKQHDYINNDLRDGSKLTNKTAEEIAHGGVNPGSSQMDGNHKYEREHRTGRRSGSRSNGAFKKDKKKQGDNGQRILEGENGPHHQQDRPSLLFENLDTGRLEEWMSFVWEKVSQWGNIFIVWLLNFLIYSLGLVLFLATSAVHIVFLLLGKCLSLVKMIRGRDGSKENGRWPTREHLRRRVGVEENIVLPSTGDEAMKRLLACKGKDPYSILGLRADSSDEEIKKYYRKQAVLVHPDKNQEPGAEEAFKILGHAFEMIGEPSKRKQYDSHTQEELEAEAMREFADMLTKLQAKIQEAANIMRCDTCEGKHRRVPVDRPFYSARYCEGCHTHHQAKEGDVWAESTMLGFYWHYYALMEGRVFDITEWMKCHRDCFKHMKANAHGVMYRIATDGNKKKHHSSNDANLEDIINRLFNKSNMGDGDHTAWSRPASADRAWTSAGSGMPGAGASSSGRKGGRKKKRR
ncbi:DnaJ-like protein subfamily C member 14 [Elysia marginata]|uniref:DnaJ-like protein subfamily C member 14 n=1 Tax=Elysia marginata TaxID=1093978 RepID=A0AAV4JEU6_9GAST|nr:DnaJ-like protein subfamily C member 14 [Elysia marginata]